MKLPKCSCAMSSIQVKSKSKPSIRPYHQFKWHIFSHWNHSLEAKGSMWAIGLIQGSLFALNKDIYSIFPANFGGALSTFLKKKFSLSPSHKISHSLSFPFSASFPLTASGHFWPTATSSRRSFTYNRLPWCRLWSLLEVVEIGRVSLLWEDDFHVSTWASWVWSIDNNLMAPPRWFLHVTIILSLSLSLCWSVLAKYLIGSPLCSCSPSLFINRRYSR